MYQLHPETNLKNSTIVVGSKIIEELKKTKDFLLVETLVTKISNTSGVIFFETIFDTLTFLYCLNVIDYQGYRVKLKVNDNT